MPKETFSSPTLERKPVDPKLEQLRAELAQIEAEERFALQAVETKLARREKELERLERDYKYYFGQAKDWKDKRVRRVKTAIAAIVGTGAMVTPLKLADQKRKAVEAKIAAAPKPTKHTPVVVTMPSDKNQKTRKDTLTALPVDTANGSVVMYPTTRAKDTSAPLPVSAPGAFREDIPETPLEAKELIMHRAEEIAKAEVSMGKLLEDTHPDTLESNKTVVVPGVSYKPDVPERLTIDPIDFKSKPFTIERRAEESLKEKSLEGLEVPRIREDGTTLELSSVKPVFPVGKAENATFETKEIPGVVFPHYQEEISPVDLSGTKAVEAPKRDTVTPSLLNVPTWTPTVSSDTVLEHAAPADHIFPEGTVPPQPGELVDLTPFTFAESNDAPAPKKKAAPVEKRSGKIQATHLDEHGNVFDPSTVKKVEAAPAVVNVIRHTAAPLESGFKSTATEAPKYVSDSTYDKLAFQVGDTVGNKVITQSIDSNVSLDSTEGRVIRVLDGHDQFGNPLYRNEYIPGGDKIELQAGLEGLQQDIEHGIEGGFKVPRILEARMDKNAWSKLLGYGMKNAMVYIERVERNENVGPWTMAVKSKGIYMIFDEHNRLKGEIPFLFGATPGDSLNTFTSSGESGGKTTPAATYLIEHTSEKDRKAMKEFGHAGEKDVWRMGVVQPDGTVLNQGLAIHAELASGMEGQERSIHSAESDDNHETIGCIRVDREGMALLKQYLKGQKRFLQYVTPEEASTILDISTNELKKLSEKEIRERIEAGIKKYRETNLVSYLVNDEKVTKDAATNVRQHEWTVTRDPKADDKARARNTKGTQTDAAIPPFKK